MLVNFMASAMSSVELFKRLGQGLGDALGVTRRNLKRPRTLFHETETIDKEAEDAAAKTEKPVVSGATTTQVELYFSKADVRVPFWVNELRVSTVGELADVIVAMFGKPPFLSGHLAEKVDLVRGGKIIGREELVQALWENNSCKATTTQDIGMRSMTCDFFVHVCIENPLLLLPE